MSVAPIQVVPLQVRHVLDLLRVGIMECGVTVSEPNAEVQRFAVKAENSPGSVTALRAGEPLFCVIFEPLWPGVASIAALISVRFAECKVAACRTIRTVLADLMEQNNLHRVQTTVRCDFPAGMRFVRWLGFRPEGVAYQYSHDRVDAIYYAVVR